MAVDRGDDCDQSSVGETVHEPAPSNFAHHLPPRIEKREPTMPDLIELTQLQYDEVPYASHPFPQTAPEHTAAVVHLFGLSVPEIATARVLELGCAAGGNLIPMAVRYPDLKAVGLDLSGVQIQQGKDRITELGISNVELRQADLAEVNTESLGEFDFIICHGVYSWVPPQVQEAILRICKQNLAPDGIAYVSYNTYPGWKAKEILRDAMVIRGNTRTTPSERLSYARGMIDFLKHVAPQNGVLAKVLEEHAPTLDHYQDHYLLHEYLEPINAPCYFQEFLKRAGQHQLGYVAEASPATMFVSNFRPEISEPLLKEFGQSQEMLEQYLDFVVNRTFRQTLLVHDDKAKNIRYQLSWERFHTLHFAAHLLRRDGLSRLDGSRQAYVHPSGMIELSGAATKSAMDVLSSAWPSSIFYPDLVKAVKENLQEANLSLPESAIETEICGLLELLVIRGLTEMRTKPVIIQNAANACIDIHPAIRKSTLLSQNEVLPTTFNWWHQMVALSVVERYLVPHLDGTNDKAALARLLQTHVADGQVSFSRNGQPIVDPDELSASIGEHIEAMVINLRQLRLIG
jgi:methyltransferase-like protein/2-polyprenyl-3-methyl-5-hydroxy-6-metoxy-1,4-benzoquinol methylase